jgi:membrane dipeptidase
MKYYTNSHSIRWDAHGCPSLKLNSDLSFLFRYKDAGVNFISLNAGFDLSNNKETIQLLESFNEWIRINHSQFGLAKNIQQILENQQKNKLSIAFDIEGCNILQTEPGLITKLYDLGVRQMSLAYNINNFAGGGCFDKDNGLSNSGKNVVKQLNKIGIVIDCSHVGEKTSLEIIELSRHPVIFSHSNPKKMHDHPRNISDIQIVECAKNGGVIGINGIGIFLGNNVTTTKRIVEHINYIVNKVGCDHVGIGLDCIFDPIDTNKYVKNNKDVFPTTYGFDQVQVAEPEQFSQIGIELLTHGYNSSEINKIMGENFFRVAKTIWK